MVGLDWEHAPEVVRHQVQRLRDGLCGDIGDNLLGLYLHGSLTLGDFVPDRSDIDLLAVLHTPMSAETKRDVARILLDVSMAPRPVEMTFATVTALRSLAFPLTYDFHYSEDWRERMQNDLASGAWRAWNKEERHDEDLSGQVAITRRHGIRLYGEPIDETLPVIPDEEAAACFVREALWAMKDIAEMEDYGILNPCRALCYLKTGLMCSKGEAGRWTLRNLPPDHARMVTAALAIRYGTGVETPTPAALRSFANYVRRALCP